MDFQRKCDHHALNIGFCQAMDTIFIVCHAKYRVTFLSLSIELSALVQFQTVLFCPFCPSFS